MSLLTRFNKSLTFINRNNFQVLIILLADRHKIIILVY